MSVFLQLVASGVLVAGVYALVAMGFVIAYRSARIFNIAYGQFAVLGAFLAWSFLGSPESPLLPIPVAAVLFLVCTVSFGLLVELVFFRKLIGKPLIASFLLSLGLLALLQGITMLIWGPGSRVMASPIPKGPVHLGEIVLAKEYLWSFGLAIAAMVGFLYLFRHTRLGLAMRASYDHEIAARCLGVSARFSAQIAWVICSIIAAMGGILLATVNGVSTGLSELVLLVLAVVLIGGLDSMVGCIFGSLILAIGGNLASFYLGQLINGIESIFGIILMVVVLLCRPDGLMGARIVKRV